MKKLFSTLLILAMVLSLVSCSSGGQKSESSATEAPAPTEAPAQEEAGQEDAGQEAAQESQPETAEEPSGSASTFPEKDVTIVVGSGAGGGLDMMSRTLQPAMSEALGVNVVVENMAGGAGSVAMQHVLDLDADGYTLYTNSVDLILNDCMQRIEYTRKDLIPVCRVQMDQSVFWVRTDSQFETMEDIIAYAKENPGRLNFGGSQAAGIDEVIVRSLFQAAEIEANYVPFDSGSESLAALLGGHVDVMHEEPASAVAQYESGEIRPILVFTEERLDAYPDVPTARELGYDITLGNWRGIFVKAGTDPEIVETLRNAIITAMDSDAYKEYATASLLDLRPGFADTEEFTQFLDDQYDIYYSVLKSLGYV